jgi:hypothetical protein
MSGRLFFTGNNYKRLYFIMLFRLLFLFLYNNSPRSVIYHMSQDTAVPCVKQVLALLGCGINV